MSRRRADPFDRQGRRRARGFVFVVVLVLTVIATILIAGMLTRFSFTGSVAELQAEDYQRHHELLGARDITEVWLLRQRPADLRDAAGSPDPAYTLALDDEQAVYRVFVADGQGTVLRTLEQVKGAENRRWLVEVLARLPAGRTDLNRRSGPWQISLGGAPDEVIDAIAAGDPPLVAALREARAQRPKEPTEFMTILTRNGVDDLVAQTIARHIAYEPVLYRLDVEVVRPAGARWYTILAEKTGNVTTIHEWRALGAPPERLRTLPRR